MHHLVNFLDVSSIVNYEVAVGIAGEDVDPKIYIRFKDGWPWELCFSKSSNSRAE